MTSTIASQRRVAWITGAGSGMGRAAALALAPDRRLALSGRRHDMLAQTAREVADAGSEAIVLPFDARDTGAVSAARDEIRHRWGRIDELVLAAGLNSPRRTWENQSVSEVEQVIDTNLHGVIHVIDAALPDLRASGSAVVVVVSSIAAWRFSPVAGVAYSASKRALAAVCETLNAQEAAAGIRACHLCPGDVDTEFLSLRPEVPDADARERMLTPDDIGRTVRFIIDAPPHVRIDELVISPVARP
ncbi:short-chain dehydrogenase/reductase SDR [Microbacterium sp. TS-1]|uniref:SDR family oxidoreductase n=1 Tax=Microbacterium sp. TS-1 TaxID=1344956 RepID=UPI00038F36DE|nr:SDR family NAD(P)-dependent oxidoreductase [Microbacterium sp. TS-1]GAD34606.1 short-chain dehydrogenase/reductase SDR [Microbacterium sp. TS-1]